MKYLPHTTLLALLGGLAGPALAQQQGSPPSLAPDGTPACEAMAEAILTATRHDADTAFWLQVAVLLNEPSNDLQAGLKAAWSERRTALETAGQQRAARLAVCAVLGHGPYDPRLRTADFSAAVDNAFSPLRIGRTHVYERMTADGLERIETTVLNQVRAIAGIPCRTVSTVETLDGAVTEQTVDWYSQHADGAVWYFGEVSQKFEDGLIVSLDGSWRAGRAGGKPGILMLHAPLLGEAYRMEFLVNCAEDVARVVAVNQTVTVAAGTFTNCVAIEETSPLETDDVAIKFYAQDVGMVLEVNQQTGERLELIQIK